MNERASVGVLGATSLVGGPLLRRLAADGRTVVACSRAASPPSTVDPRGITWIQPGGALPVGFATAPTWITACPLWVVPEHLAWLEACGISTLVAVSSTSALTKERSPDRAEREVARALVAAETRVTEWAARRGVRLCLLRPTMIYDGVRDGNLAAIAGFIRRFGWFPVAGAARGLRQPVHADDVAWACVAAAFSATASGAYTLSGAAALPFRDLVATVFRGCGRPPRIVHLPQFVWRIALPVAHAVGVGLGATTGMAARMNEDLAFDHEAAARDLDFRPRPFAPDTLLPGPEAVAGAPPRVAVPS
jgi:nucleoside-diphosphate-sugar epimerase